MISLFKEKGINHLPLFRRRKETVHGIKFFCLKLAVLIDDKMY
jgi:hypothetical protein